MGLGRTEIGDAEENPSVRLDSDGLMAQGVSRCCNDRDSRYDLGVFFDQFQPALGPNRLPVVFQVGDGRSLVGWWLASSNSWRRTM